MIRKTFGTFAGVFTPTTLTILGVILYIRQPWVVGNAGIVGALLIVLISVIITLATALSISSIVTNVKIGSGGAFSVISQSLGLEIGGAIGIPFYIAQAIAVAMYIFGFREGLQMLISDFNPILLDLFVFTTVMTIAFISTSFAFKIQYVILGIIALSLISIYGGLFSNELNFEFELFGTYPGSIENNFSGSSFWVVFAVFFPAVTGVMAGANMSGDLTDPRKSIPRGTLSAVILTTIIYVSTIFVAALLASPKELVSNYNIFIEKSLFPPIVIAGLLGATLSSALGSFVGAPRILLALGEKNIIPKSTFLAKTSKKGEPYNAMLVTVIIVIIGISLRDLNTIAPLLTMFFMITYAMVNVVALIELSLGLPSYRPSLKIPIIVPLIGAFGSISIMFIINSFVALISTILIIAFYFYLVKMQIKSTAGDSRSGLFTALAEWATQKTTELSPKLEARSWRPDILFPASYPKDIRSSIKIIESIVTPKGSIKIVGIKHDNPDEQKRLKDFIPYVVTKFKDINIPISYTMIENYEYSNSINVCMQSLNVAFFKPNTILINIDPTTNDLSTYNKILANSKINDYGLLLYIPFSTANIGMGKNISVWINNLPSNWKNSYNVSNNDLAILISLLIDKNWNGTIDVNLIEEHFKQEDVIMFKEMIRFPQKTNLYITPGKLLDRVPQDRKADINIISIPPNMTVEEMVEIVNSSRVSALFCYDSGYENVFV
jgi:amino acid transporter